MPKFPPQSIEVILFSFRKYNIGDVIHNRKKPIAAMLLGLCFIDQASCFLNNHKAYQEQFETFVDKYLPMYSGIELYNYLRNGLIHNYSGTGHFRIAWNVNFPYVHKEHEEQVYIGSHFFIMNVIKAFRKFEHDARNDSNIAKNMMAWSERHPIMSYSTVSIPLPE